MLDTMLRGKGSETALLLCLLLLACAAVVGATSVKMFRSDE